MEELTIRQKIDEASAIFVFGEKFGEKPSPKKIGQSLATLEQCLKWTKENSIGYLENKALWGIYLCHSRMKQPSLAADALLQIWRNLEATRRGISDPQKRGGVFGEYTHLFDALCENLQKSGRTKQLLETIEASKGRGMADILTKKSGKAVADADIYGAVKVLPKLTQKYGFHYITYYVDTVQTYAVLVSKRGDIHAIEPIPISKKDVIRKAAQYVDPVLWGEPDEDDPSIMIEDVSEVLSPLVQFLESLLDQDIVSIGDHISYSADDSFINVPLQYLALRDLQLHKIPIIWLLLRQYDCMAGILFLRKSLKGKTLIDNFSLSKIHSAFHLEKVLSETVLDSPTEFISFFVPRRQDLQNENWPKMKQNMLRPAQWLGEHLRGQVFEYKRGTVGQVTKQFSEKEIGTVKKKHQNLIYKIVHFSTHGIFPKPQKKQNPFYQSGLVLSSGKDLPDEDDVSKGLDDKDKMPDYVLTPSKVFNLKLEFRNSHLSLMACVSGLSQEGLAGDALGLEWAFIQAGAASLLSSHWYVSAEDSAIFFESFYEHWIDEKKSRAQAYCEAVNDLRTRLESPSRPIWAAFSLTGDWR